MGHVSNNLLGDDSEEDEVDVDETSTSDDDSSESEDADSVVLSTRSTPSLDRSEYAGIEDELKNIRFKWNIQEHCVDKRV